MAKSTAQEDAFEQEEYTQSVIGRRAKVGAGLIVATLIGLYVAAEASRLSLWIYHGEAAGYRYDLLYDTHLWLLPFVFVAAIVSGWLAGRGYWLSSDAGTVKKEGYVRRQSLATFLEHWSIAIGAILFAGGGAWVGSVALIPRFAETSVQVGLGLNVQYIGALFLAFGVTHHVINHWFFGGAGFYLSWKDFRWTGRYIGSVFGLTDRPTEHRGKYLPTQRVSYAIWAVLVTGIGGTGLVMAYDMWLDVPAAIKGPVIDLNYALVLLLIVFIVFHVVVKLMPSNWARLTAAFTGRIPEEFVEEHHPEWHDQLEGER